MSVDEIKDKMDLVNIMENRPWHIQACCAKTGDGLYDGLDWIATNIQQHQQNIDKLQKGRELIRLLFFYRRGFGIAI